MYNFSHELVNDDILKEEFGKNFTKNKCATIGVLMAVVITVTGCVTASVTIETPMKWDLITQDHLEGKKSKFKIWNINNRNSFKLFLQNLLSDLVEYDAKKSKCL